MVLIDVDKEKDIYVCKLCGKTFRSFYELDTHMMFGHRDKVEEEFAKVQGLPEPEPTEVEKYIKKSETALETMDVREIYNKGPYVLKINNDVILRGRSWKDVFEGYIKYLYQTLNDIRQVSPNLYNMFKEIYDQVGFDATAWKEVMIELAKENNITIESPNRYNSILEAMKQLGFIEDYYCEKNKTKPKGSQG